MRVATLFSGAGGLDLGFEKAGFAVVWANEFDKQIWQTFEMNHKTTFLEKRSIRELTVNDLPDDIDGLIGGPPCQSWSLAGTMRGINDERGSLFFEYIRLLNLMQPKFFVVENVKGIISKAHKQTFDHILSLFEQSGYDCKYQLLDAADYGVPQNRERVFVVGIRSDLKIDFEFPKPLKDKILMQDVLAGLENAVPFIKDGEQPDIPNNEYFVGGFSSMYMSRNRRRDFSECSFTIQASGRHAPLHPSSPKMEKVDVDEFRFKGEGERRLSVRECARIQTFPDDFIFYYKDINQGYKMVGNAVPVNLAFELAKQIKTYF